MANPFAPMANASIPGPMGNMMQMLQRMNPAQLKSQFANFCNNLQGNPQQIVMDMVNSGRVSQEQLNMVQQMVRPVQQMMGMK